MDVKDDNPPDDDVPLDDVSVVSAEVAANDVLNGRRFGDDRKEEKLVLALALNSCVVDVDDRAENLDDDGITRTH